MSRKTTKKGGQWHGDEVQPAASGQAERGADRAEGHTPVSAESEAERLRDDANADDAGVRSRAASGSARDDKTAEVAEEHQEERNARGRPPRGAL